MSKMQIIAKTALTVLGIYAIAASLTYITLPLKIQSSATCTILMIAMFAVFLFYAIRVLIFDNNRLAQKISGPGENLTPDQLSLWLTASLRIGLVLAGMILISSSIPTILKILAFPLYVGPFIEQLFVYKELPSLLDLTLNGWFNSISNILQALLAVYLLLGAPGFIQLQLNILNRQTLISERPNNE
jgi:hypothetical protein